MCVCEKSDDLQQYEVEDFIAQLMHQEFDTLVDDGSLPQVCPRRQTHGAEACVMSHVDLVMSHGDPLCAGVWQSAADVQPVATGGATAAQTQY